VPAACGSVRRFTRQAPQNVALVARGVAWVERQPVGQLFDSIAVQVYLELIPLVRVKAGRWDFARDGVTDIITKTVPTSPRKR
jgi:hypothetical protein